jgi:transglutaminase-like putative cysteine protease
MNRREFLRCAGAVSAGLALPGAPSLFARAPADRWRTFEVTTEVEVLHPKGTTRVWLPSPPQTATAYQKPAGADSFVARGGKARVVVDPKTGARMIAAEWSNGVTPVMTAVSRVATRDYAVDLASPRHASAASRAELAHFLQPTSLLPTDGIVRATAMEITRKARTDVEKARAIYEWIVENTHREASVRGCGFGDIRFMLESKNLGGKCADLNALYVGLARAAGLPARDVYGIRVAKSELGYKSLGTSSDVITRAQHCRAEVYLASHGWTPVDPADVRKVILEEPPGNLSMFDPKVTSARARLFGSWEMNWMAYNTAYDVTLPGAAPKPLPFLMYPQAETGGARLDSLDPDGFRYKITAREVQASRALRDRP